MKASSWRLPLAGVAAGALCIALAAGPSPANPPDDEDSIPQPKKEIRVYKNDNSEDATPEVRKDIRVYKDPDGSDRDPGDRDSEEAQVQGGYLGVRVQDITRELQRAKDLPSREGALINRVEVESPAANAGIRRGDVIVELDRHPIGDSSDLISQVRDLEPGAKVPVVVVRNGARKTLTVTLAKRPKELTMTAPRGERHWIDRADEDMPGMPPIGEQLDRIRVYRQDIQRQLDEIQDQLVRLRERDLQRLEDEIKALRDELRARDQRRSPGSD